MLYATYLFLKDPGSEKIIVVMAVNFLIIGISILGAIQ